MAEVIPAIIPKSFDDLKRQAQIVAPFVKSAQIDIMDGKFAPEPSFPFIDNDISNLATNYSREIRLGFELDMMVENPEQYFDDWIKFGIGTFIIHFESTNKLDELINILKEKGKGVAIAFKPETSIKEIEQYVEKVDFIQVMGNDKIGFHGVSLDEKVYEIVRDLRNRFKDSIISVDIGVNFETAPKLVEAGVSKLVSGSAIYNSDNIEEAIQKLSLM